ncbi:MAG: HepT-like ribonuclease domain-containing protein [Candidatus Dormibacteria bacterium]
MPPATLPGPGPARGGRSLNPLDPDRLEHIRDTAALLLRWRERGEDAFLTDELLQAAMIRKLHELTEAATLLSQDVQDRHPEIDWPGIRGFRNIIVHGYLSLNLERCWALLGAEVEPLGTLAAAELAE